MTSNSFKAVNAAALSSGLLLQWYPKAKRYGHSLRIGNLEGDEGASLWICLKTGAWKDHATGVSGGDVISLYATREGISNSQALKKMSGHPTRGNSILRLGSPPLPLQRDKDTPHPASKNRDYALKLWSESQPAENSLVQTYLNGRGITCTIPPDIRFLSRPL